MRLILFLLPLFILTLSQALQAQFVDHFEDGDVDGWDYYTGDGEATVTFTPGESSALIMVDASDDRHNVWWAIIKRNVASYLDMEKLQQPEYELRVEARVKVSHAPRRLNFMINTQRTTDYHKQLREYDIQDATGWHVISMTTEDLDAMPGDDLNVQLGVTDWGYGTYKVELDYYKAAIVNVNEAEPDKGEPLVYHPPIPPLESFSHKLMVSQDAVVNTTFPEVNFSNWQVESRYKVPVLTVDDDQWAILRWDFDDINPLKAESAGMLELSTYSVIDGGNYEAVYGEELGMEFGKVRIIEILGGKENWTDDTVTYEELTEGQPYEAVFNEQMIFDTEVTYRQGGKTHVSLSRPVMQRLLSGITKGILIKPLGAINASFYSSEAEQDSLRPRIYFNTVSLQP
ncbi:hypothetical protein [Gracilimonas mengyeensis]|uniref:Uncharacterized protein n=1 Tax=Gracilimonas mengyeensis TaxID=1302730 RepID=A0A521EUG3_9BACT|nr:hypothetical protein [Gracilimonas mengyeensis]SMO86760.1 hypothetical protein SAMN06265219_11390 [Gracilimonas mengyeensis]